MIRALPLESASLLTRASDALSLAKPRITLLALLATAAGIKLAPNLPTWPHIFFTLLGTALLVGGAGALNMFLERDQDLLMERTRYRPLPSQRLSPEFGLGLGSLLIGIAIPLLAIYVNLLVAALGVVSLAIYILIYTPLKKRTSISLLIGAIPGAMPPLLGWTAATNSLSLPGWILFGIVFFWQVPHFLAIGLFRREEYARAGYKIFPQHHSYRLIQIQMLLYSLLLVPVSLALYPLELVGSLYLGVVGFLNLLFVGLILLGFRRAQDTNWARSTFLVSLLYLSLLFGVLFVETS